MVVQSSHVILYLTSMEPTTSSKTQQKVLVQSSQTVLNICGTNSFINNSVGHDGGAIVALNNSVLNFIGTNNFINNSAYWFGGAIYKYDNILTFSGTSNFINNSASSGGAICANVNSH